MSKLLTAVFLLLITCVAPAIAADNSNPTTKKDAVVLQIDGMKVTLADFEAKQPMALFQARNNFYEAERKAVQEYADEFLLEQEAQKEKLTVPELLDRHVNNTIAKDPSEEALRVYFEGLDTAEPYETVRGKILDVIHQRRIAKAKTAYLQSLRSHVTITIPMDPPRATISLKETPVRGTPDAQVTVVEYADYECPYCQQIQPALTKLEADYKGKLNFVFKDAPLPMHSHAEGAAEAAHCAGAQGKYWEYHDLLFTSKQLDVVSLKAQARSLKLNGEAFDKCLDSGQSAEAVKTSLTEAQTLGVPGTPGFFINGRFLNPNGNVSYDVLRQMIEEELHASAEQAKAPVSRASSQRQK